jgi:ectoine hydroxylase-related dioxygenase (phytanoyl-CoA dioxygenase family)
MTYNTLVSEFAREGYVILPGLLEPTRADALHAAFDELPLGESPTSVPGATLGRRQANERALLRNERFRDVIREPELLRTVEAALGEDIHLIAYEALEVPPGGGKRRDWHCDFHFITSAPLVANVGIYLQDMDDEAGPLLIIPQSHTWEREPTTDEVESELPDELALRVGRGTAVVFHGRLWHSASQNQTSKPRRALFPYFGQAWIKRMDEFYLTPLPDEIQNSDDPHIRQLFDLDHGTVVHGTTYAASNRDWQ